MMIPGIVPTVHKAISNTREPSSNLDPNLFVDDIDISPLESVGPVTSSSSFAIRISL